MAMTADGKIDTLERRGARISGPADSARVDRLRAGSDAVMVGGRTLLAEDPRLTLRDADLVAARSTQGRPPQPTKVAVVTRIGIGGGRDAVGSGPGGVGSGPGGVGVGPAPALPSPSRFLGDGGSRVIVATTEATTAAARAWLVEQGAEVIVHEAPRVDLVDLLHELRRRGIERLMVEGGSTLVAALLDLALVDELQLAIAPLLFGGESAPTPVGGRGRPLDDAVRLSLLGSEVNEDGDVILRYRVDTGARS
jgi:2,5-diamino-6-(ribosylamino)-4(3H)-pyrimidinone 5'-phosphate reductase